MKILLNFHNFMFIEIVRKKKSKNNIVVYKP